MPSVLDLAARLADCLKGTEFRGHSSRLAMHKDPSELQRIQWSLYHSPLVRNMGYDDAVRAYDAATALCKKFRLPCRTKEGDVRECWRTSRSIVKTKVRYRALFGRVPTMAELRAIGAMGGES